jgi:hypothetical protein
VPAFPASTSSWKTYPELAVRSRAHVARAKALALDGTRARGTVSIKVEVEKGAPLQWVQVADSENELHAAKQCEPQQPNSKTCKSLYHVSLLTLIKGKKW